MNCQCEPKDVPCYPHAPDWGVRFSSAYSRFQPWQLSFSGSIRNFRLWLKEIL